MKKIDKGNVLDALNNAIDEMYKDENIVYRSEPKILSPQVFDWCLENGYIIKIKDKYYFNSENLEVVKSEPIPRGVN